MPNIKSSKKRVLVNNKKTEQNKNIRSAVKSDIKKIELLIKDNKIEEATKFLPEVFKSIDSACSKNILHANTAAHKKAKISKKLAVASKVEVKVEKKVEVKVEKKVEVKAEPKIEVKAEEVVAEVKPARKPRAKKTSEPKAE